MSGFTKIFSSILVSTIWDEPWEVKGVWITMLAMADRNGDVLASVPGLARYATVTVEQCEAALAKFMSPDKYSRTPDEDGRRIKIIDGGWNLLNYIKYREKDSPIRASLDMAGYVYYASEPGSTEVKIGFSKNPWSRINDLRVAKPAIEILATERGTMATERERHQQFRDLRKDGEWFTLSASLRSFIRALSERDSRKKGNTIGDDGNPIVTTVVPLSSYGSATVAAEAEAEAESTTTTPLPPSGGKRVRRTRDEITEPYPEQVRKVVNAALRPDFWPKEDPRDHRAITVDVARLCSNVAAIMAAHPSIEPEDLILGMESYVHKPKERYCAPQFFFGSKERDGSDPHWLAEYRMIRHRKMQREAAQQPQQQAPALRDGQPWQEGFTGPLNAENHSQQGDAR